MAEKKEIAIEVDKNKLSYYGLSLKNIIDAVKAENVIYSAGSVYSDVLQTTVRLDSQYTDAKEIEDISITSAKGKYIALKDVAEVKVQDKRVTMYSRVNGNDAIALEVYKASGANIVKTADGVVSQLEKLRASYPEYTFTMVYDQSDFIRSSLKNTLHTLLEGLVTTSLVLYLFLRGWKSSSAVIVAIPVSLIATFFLMYMAGFTFNMMSLMGMALCIGILVDDSIVVLENIHRFLEKGYAADEAAEKGRNQIGMAAVAMTLCDIVVFLPIAFLESTTGQYFKEFGLTIVFATLMSLVVSFTLTPMMASKLYANGLLVPQGKFWNWVDRFEYQATEDYGNFLKRCLAKPKKIMLGIAFAFISSVMLVPLGLVGSEYMPRTDENAIQISIELPRGYNADKTNEVLVVFDEYLAKVPEVEHYLSKVTTTESNGKISVTLFNRSKRDKSVWEIADEFRSFSRANFGDVKIRVNEIQSSVTGVSGGRSLVRSPVQVELYGRDMNLLIEESQIVQKIFAETEGLKDIKSSYTEGVPELKVVVDRDKLKYYGTSVENVLKSFSAAVAGRTAGVLANDSANEGRDTNINVRFTNSDGFYIEDIKSIPVPTKNSQTVSLGDVAKVEEGVGPITIRRVNKERIINIQSNLSDRPLKEVLEEIDKKIIASGIKSRYEFTGQAMSMNDSFAEMAIALSMSLILIYLLLAVLYESAFTPLIRMFSLPLGIIGALYCLLFTGNTINLYSLIGILVMDGLVAKNGTLLLDYTLTLMHEEGKPAIEAIIEAGKARLKPILMTALTMVVGMLPTALAMTDGSETRVSMAWVIIGGMITSTVFTLIVIPIIFIWIKNKFPKRI